MTQEKFQLKYSPELDGLRGAAILSVMAFHAHAPFLKGGFIGVDAFFVLSGFLITSLLVSEYDRYISVSLKNFYMRRMLRLAPALIVLLLIFCLISFLFLSYQQANRNYIDSLISLFYLSNWARAFSLHPPYFLGHTWSLSIEEQFYIVWPILLLTLLRFSSSRKVVVFFTASLALLAWALRVYLHMKGATPERLYNGLDTRADALMVGCALGVAYASGFFNKNNRKLILSKILVIISPVSALILLTFSVIANWRSPYMYQFGFFAIELLTATIVVDVMVNNKSIIKRILATKALVWTGSISYGLYLWHYPIYRAMFLLEMSGLVVITIGSLITFAVAALSYYFMEKPILMLKKRFAHKTPNKSIQSTSAALRSAESADA